ncbi:variant surface glycoprotein (VSG)-related,putative [Trypanosoma brucei gambiense DAL972]|uniref:Variant surface glycoprotein (VSG)-related,putative n=1 Tax=Trypanosoma brucei gambiense (strain MHOM/CI/86/DAL972) TaxID=679716 RepID=C9ZKF1_TRYB9|nr:variant surface glycoprotein (VSG)-related,putative [Trypanosoma brucei gambiense DAL972]CBH09917.1 variant surface glycoprotein (VSG)-related,putative [Trypanosoma brucei gambiense DAL972]|eukprot:XP_011772208.1 variant surface glycoprotein (VSG)-related,putative [Trypanosoma brucei gambiense DAL972]
MLRKAMWKILVTMLCVVWKAAGLSVPAAEIENTLNQREFDVLCSFLNLTLRIHEWVEKERLTAEVANDFDSSAMKVLYGSDSDGSLNWTGKEKREADCGYTSIFGGGFGGKALALDLLCLCRPSGNGDHQKNLCCEANAWYDPAESWGNKDRAEESWGKIKQKCTEQINIESIGFESLTTTVQNLRKKLNEMTEKTTERETKRLGHGYEPITKSCGGSGSANNAPCVFYKMEGRGANQVKIEWLTQLEDLVKRLKTPKKESAQKVNKMPPQEQREPPIPTRGSPPRQSPPEIKVQPEEDPSPEQRPKQSPSTATDGNTPMAPNTSAATQSTTDPDSVPLGETRTNHSLQPSHQPLRPKNVAQAISPLVVFLLFLL